MIEAIMEPFANIERRIEFCKNRKYVSEEYLNFHKEILRLRYRNKERLVGYVPYPELLDEEAETRLKSGIPLIDLKKLKLKPEMFEDSFKEIYFFLKKYCEKENNTGRIIDLEKSKDIDLIEFIKKFIGQDGEYFRGIAKKFKIDLDTILFIVKNLAIPLLELCAERLSLKVKQSIWGKSYCPICGNKPGMAKLEKEEGKRILQCSLCNTMWIFKRLECPFCSNTEQRTLKFFYVEEEAPYRVDVCDKCRGYLKTVDGRKLCPDKEIFLPVEDIATLYLDIIAEKEGYKKFYGERALEHLVF